MTVGQNAYARPTTVRPLEIMRLANQRRLKARREADDESEDEVALLPAGESLLLAESARLVSPCRAFLCFAMVVIFALIVVLRTLKTEPISSSCDSIDHGYQCKSDISHYWGHYSPYFSVPSLIDDEVPQGCNITFAQVLSRHGARDPTTVKTLAYAALIDQLHANVDSFTGKYNFLASYKYTLGENQLTAFGRQQMINSGISFYNRYQTLARQHDPFVRTVSKQRILESSLHFTQGFHAAKLADNTPDPSFPYDLLLLPDNPEFNNSLHHGRCTNFERTHHPSGGRAEDVWAAIFIPAIQTRLNTELPGANLTIPQTIYMMDLCPFDTVASPNGTPSPFCALFTHAEWQQYNYYQSLSKYYGFSHGAPLGPTQGAGFTNELIARMTNKPVTDRTSTNSTLDNDSSTFPLGPDHVLYADFSSDNGLTGHFSAMGLYNDTRPLPTTELQTIVEMAGYSSAWTVPFAARAYFEKMRCEGVGEELVRILVNDRVLPLRTCGGDALGRCRLGAWVESLSFAREGGFWDRCFS